MPHASVQALTALQTLHGKPKDLEACSQSASRVVLPEALSGLPSVGRTLVSCLYILSCVRCLKLPAAKLAGSGSSA